MHLSSGRTRGLGCPLAERAAHQLLELRAPRVRLVERGARGALLLEQRLRVGSAVAHEALARRRRRAQPLEPAERERRDVLRGLAREPARVVRAAHQQQQRRAVRAIEEGLPDDAARAALDLGLRELRREARDDAVHLAALRIDELLHDHGQRVARIRHLALHDAAVDARDVEHGLEHGLDAPQQHLLELLARERVERRARARAARREPRLQLVELGAHDLEIERLLRAEVVVRRRQVDAARARRSRASSSRGSRAPRTARPRSARIRRRVAWGSSWLHERMFKSSV